MVTGTAAPRYKLNEDHAWNIVKLGGVCAHVGVTWDSTMRIGNEPCYDHFNITDDDMSQDHVWNRSLFPRCTSNLNNYFFRKKSLIKSDSELKIYILTQLQAGNKSFTIKFADRNKDQNQAMSRVNNALCSIPGIRYNEIRLIYNPVRNVAFIALS